MLKSPSAIEPFRLFDRIECSREQTDAAKQIPEAGFRANRIKHRIHGEIRHPDSTTTIGSLKPLVGLVFIIQSGVDLCHTVR